MLERRSFEIRAAKPEEGKSKIEGHAAVFDSPTDLGWFIEQIEPGAFRKAIARDDVRALMNHDPNYVLGRNRAGTLSLAEDNVGLAMSIDPPDTQWANDLLVSMERGDISQCSFGFRTIKDAWDETDPNKPIRTLCEVELFDVSVVTFPAYPDTDAQVRSAQQIFESRQAARQDSGKPGETADYQEVNLRHRLQLLKRDL